MRRRNVSRWHVCTRKMRYESFALADQAAGELERRLKRPVSAYQCPFDPRHWHAGKTPKRLLKRKDAA